MKSLQCLSLSLSLVGLLCFSSCKNGEKTERLQANTNVNPADSVIPVDQSDTPNDGIFELISVMDSTSNTIVKKQRPINAISTAISKNPIKKTDPVPPSYNRPSPKTPQDSRVIRVLTHNYWAVWGLVKIKQPEANQENQGVWFKFKEDGSYDYGYYDQKIGSGAWSFDGMKATILLDSELLGDDREWSIKIASTEEVMIWVGTDRFATTHVQAKLQNYLFPPKTRADMGYENE